MFKKPRRHFRQRRNTDGSEQDEEDQDGQELDNKNQNENGLQVTSNVARRSKTKGQALTNSKLKSQKDNSNKKNVGSKLSSTASAPMSFELDEEEGETFQIKKSSQSRKIIKRLKKEKKLEASEKENGSSDYQREAGTSIVVNGEQAFDMDLDSDCEPEKADNAGEDQRPQHSFKSLLERGEIPDANLIHLARKKRAQAREQGDYIPLDDTDKVDSAPKSTQRLVRDDDNDMSDDEDRVDFTVNSGQRERQHMKDTFLAAEHGSDDADSDHDRDWEQQQIRKVVGAREPQVASTDAEYSSYYSMGQVDPSQMMSAYDQAGSGSLPSDRLDVKPLPDTVSIDQVRRSLTERLNNLQIVHRVHTQERDNVHAGIIQSEKSTAELENKSSDSVLSKLNTKYTFMQQVRSYIRDLLDCFNEKYTRICELDFSLMTLAKTRSTKLCKRRQDDIKDEASDCSTISKAAQVQSETPAQKRQQAVKSRRVADREARRTRRRQARQNSRQVTPRDAHHDGMSSDDEESKSDVIKYQADRDKLLSEAHGLFDDVVEEFSSVSEILGKFEEWKTKYTDDYNDAYVGLCLPKLLTPLIKLSLMSWNPMEVNCKQLTDLQWYRSVVLYGHTAISTFNSTDPDNQLVPMIVEKVLIPKLTGYVDMVWDPVSKSQTHGLTTLLHGLVDECPTLNTSSKNTATLLKAISMRINVSLDEDTFMPLFATDLLRKSPEAKQFLHRQIWSSIKLYQNILQFSTLLSDSKLRHLALDCLLNRYIMLGLQCAGPDGCLQRIRAVTDALPPHWLKSSSNDRALPELENLCRFIKSCATAFHQSDNRDDLKGLLKVLVNIHAHDHATWMSEEFSLRMPK